MAKIKIVKANSILTRSGLPGSDWVFNPYIGLYCYAAQIARWKHSSEGWESY